MTKWILSITCKKWTDLVVMALKKNMNLVELAGFVDFPVAQTVKNLPAMQETRVQSLGPEDTLKNGKATHSSIFAWGIPRTEESGRLQSMGLQRVGQVWVTNAPLQQPFNMFVLIIGLPKITAE